MSRCQSNVCDDENIDHWIHSTANMSYFQHQTSRIWFQSLQQTSAVMISILCVYLFTGLPSFPKNIEVQ